MIVLIALIALAVIIDSWIPIAVFLVLYVFANTYPDKKSRRRRW